MSSRATDQLSPETIVIVQKTAPLVAKHALEITKTFYPMMFSRNPEALQFFNRTNQARGRQPQALANAVIAYAQNIDNLSQLADAVEVIAHKHCALGVQPEHYRIVETNLMLAIQKVLGSAVTPEVAAAWKKAVGALSKILIGREEALYQEAEKRKGGFRDWQEFQVAEKRLLAADTMLFTFRRDPEDSFEFTPGQFLTVMVDTGDKYPARRHYTVVSEPGANHLSIAVRRVTAESKNMPPGVVSTHLHDKMQEGDSILIMPPFGGFHCNANSDSTVLLLSAGIGVTPIQSFLRHCKEIGCQQVIVIHQDRSPDHVAFKDILEQANQSTFFFSQVDLPGQPQKRVDEADIKSALATAKADPKNINVFMCGPPGFMNDCTKILQSLGVTQIHSERFGPQLSGV
eukprot:CAMPEP_0201552728 /NCGR_PEP_ID=MMETSP0173_2-20130828/17127_1 /ASSEMBLY_ACC=CAM_ASM_000268 /TAXON_ID=218659 /ORGANISM="Vexillifera sp., Strain DIVA3 564/2" /LENGTH=401 /DNA_ID=CAMNT_0047963253 /DNA_START=22 /DNA_END=1227 /DNA_ORIENTATION=-